MLNNPAARILSLALVTVLTNYQNWQGLLVLLLPVIFLFISFPAHGKVVTALARKLRWFFLSIVVLYLWFYPGELLWPQLGALSPVREGLNEALLRIASLLIIISYCGFLVCLTPREQLIAGIQWILAPLRLIGVETERFAVRTALVLEILPGLKLSNENILNKSDARSLADKVDHVAKMMAAAGNPTTSDIESYKIRPADMPRPGKLDFIIPVLLIIWMLVSLR